MSPGGGRTVLLTGGRAAATLELARILWRAGDRVLMAESAPWHLCRASRAVRRSFTVPWPRRDPEAFAAALEEIVRAHRVDLLIPTCEEIFYVAMFRERLARACRVLATTLDRLAPLHGKHAFAELSARHGLAVPETRLLRDEADLRALGDPSGWVFKPEYSRFAARTVVRPARLDFDPIATADDPHARWVAQRYVDGRHLCCYGVAVQGRLTALATYPTTFTLGVGAAIAFESVEHAGVRRWVERLVEAERFDGQIAFDFIEADDGTLFAIECNPRLTSGVHLFAHRPEFVDALTRPLEEVVTPGAARPSMLGVAMLLYGTRAVRRPVDLVRWVRSFTGSREVVWDWRDPLPALWRYVGLGGIVWRARRYRVSAQQAATLDFEWNGEMPPALPAAPVEREGAREVAP